MSKRYNMIQLLLVESHTAKLVPKGFPHEERNALFPLLHVRACMISSSASCKHLIHLEEHINKSQAPGYFSSFILLCAEVLGVDSTSVIGIEY
jgi:hypothetical protein